LVRWATGLTPPGEHYTTKPNQHQLPSRRGTAQREVVAPAPSGTGTYCPWFPDVLELQQRDDPWPDKCAG